MILCSTFRKLQEKGGKFYRLAVGPHITVIGAANPGFYEDFANLNAALARAVYWDNCRDLLGNSPAHVAELVALDYCYLTGDSRK